MVRFLTRAAMLAAVIAFSLCALAGIFVLTVFALLLDFLVTRIEARLLVWRPKTAETEAM